MGEIFPKSEKINIIFSKYDVKLLKNAKMNISLSNKLKYAIANMVHSTS